MLARVPVVKPLAVLHVKNPVWPGKTIQSGEKKRIDSEGGAGPRGCLWRSAPSGRRYEGIIQMRATWRALVPFNGCVGGAMKMATRWGTPPSRRERAIVFRHKYELPAPCVVDWEDWSRFSLLEEGVNPTSAGTRPASRSKAVLIPPGQGSSLHRPRPLSRSVSLSICISNHRLPRLTSRDGTYLAS